MNTFGRQLRLTTFGESHGVALGGVIDGMPAGLSVAYKRIDSALQRRRNGDGETDATTQRKEADTIEWLSGLLDGVTTGQPITFIIRNHDTRSEDYDEIRRWLRPGHADRTVMMRYGIRDWRGGGRSSGRETVVRVVAGMLARQLCERWWPHFTVESHVDATHCVVCTIQGVPAGIGTPLFDRVSARMAHAIMSIPSAIGYESGVGFAAAQWDGHQWRDEWNADGSTQTNHCGGIQGGISNGMPITFRAAFHAPVTTIGPTHCLDVESPTVTEVHINGRHDIDHISRIPVIVESMACLTLADIALSQSQPYDQNKQ